METNSSKSLYIYFCGIQVQPKPQAISRSLITTIKKKIAFIETTTYLLNITLCNNQDILSIYEW